MTVYARCPSCRTSDSIVVTEVHEEIGATDPGRHEIRGGQVIPASEFIFTPGDPVRVEMGCERCGHSWRARRTVGTQVTDETGLGEAEMERIAAACNSAIWFLQRSTGDQVAPTPWLKDAPPWAVESTYDSIRAVQAGVTMEQLWRHWAAAKRADGWVHGEVKDPVRKTHPCLVDDYSQLSARERYKDRVFGHLARRGQEAPWNTSHSSPPPSG